MYLTNKTFLTFFFTLVIFFLIRQVPFKSYSFIMNIALILFFIFNIKNILSNLKQEKDIYFIIQISFIILLIYILYALFIENEITLIIRFLVILFLIILAYLVKPNKIYIRIFMILITIQALFIIGFEMYLIYNFNLENYKPIRAIFLNNAWGDVYTYTGQWWKIQLKGNALLPFAFFLSIIYYSGFKRIVFVTIFILSIFCAGNFAFILGILLFSGLFYLYEQRWTIQKIIIKFSTVSVLVLLVSLPAYSYLQDVVAKKAISSNPIRVDQSNVLVDNMSKNITTLLLGRGLGNTINIKTQWRDYSDKIYYELQSLYILNQVGLLFFIWFMFINILLSKYFIKYNILLIVYGSYIFYAFFNPYFLDTNQVVVIVILLSLRKVLDEKSILNTSSI